MENLLSESGGQTATAADQSLEESALSKLARESDVVLGGAALGLVKYGVSSISEEPLSFGASVGLGLAFSAALKGPPILRGPATVAAAAFTAKFAFDSLAAVNDCLPIVQRVWNSDAEQSQNREAIAARLGPVAFNILTAHVTAKVTPRLFEFGARIPTEIRTLANAGFEFGPRLAYEGAGRLGASSRIFSASQPDPVRHTFLSRGDRLERQLRVNPEKTALQEGDRFAERSVLRDVMRAHRPKNESAESKQSRLEHLRAYWKQLAKERAEQGPESNSREVQLARANKFLEREEEMMRTMWNKRPR